MLWRGFHRLSIMRGIAISIMGTGTRGVCGIAKSFTTCGKLTDGCHLPFRLRAFPKSRDAATEIVSVALGRFAGSARARRDFGRACGRRAGRRPGFRTVRTACRPMVRHRLRELLVQRIARAPAMPRRLSSARRRPDLGASPALRKRQLQFRSQRQSDPSGRRGLRPVDRVHAQHHRLAAPVALSGASIQAVASAGLFSANLTLTTHGTKQ